ncbi:hypothetical protein BDP27DRAFT_111446 [Rhodocollybia butyracea]|uniref:Uncharacterized protein n=1 Tax=Rhodocollybia butyracea TaxID=206335 RepID=A0A9P5PKA4_9AGAR|nr:hypothetical protein BDP27DRAFT_111446 [Rhodocollybia butyracea]
MLVVTAVCLFITTVGSVMWAVQYPGPYWTLQNTQTGGFLMLSNVNNPVGKRVEMGSFQIGWKLAPHGRNTFIVNRGPAVALNHSNSGSSTLQLVSGSYNQVYEFRPVP